VTPSPRTPTALTEVVLHHSDGVVEARGHLTRQGADLVAGSADGLRGAGHAIVVVDLGRVDGVDDAGMDVLAELRASFTATGGQLLVRPAPAHPTPA
jgi:anti-anti-sigma regulatory factor